VSEVVLSRSARSDLISIDWQTLEKFGVTQSLRTEAAFRQAFESLTMNPLMGEERGDLSPPGRTFRLWVVLKRFLIVYRPSADGIRVARILDGTRDLPNVLAQNPGDD
jgi:plasmid stabilization system protein ParE